MGAIDPHQLTKKEAPPILAGLTQLAFINREFFYHKDSENHRIAYQKGESTPYQSSG
jgi:hypothetical protein